MSIDNQVSERELKNQLLAYRTALESIVLLKNDNNILPLNCDDKMVVYGSGAIFTINTGVGSGNVNSRFSDSIINALTSNDINLLDAEYFRNVYQAKNNEDDNFSKYIKKNIRHLNIKNLVNSIFETPNMPYVSLGKLEDADKCLYVISRQCNENSDLKNEEGGYLLTTNEINDLSMLNDKYSDIILIINAPSGLDLSPLDDLSNIKGIVNYGYGGMVGAKALSDILLGKVSPSGKLSITWPKHIEDIPNSKTFGKNVDSIDYNDGIYVGYRYFDTFNVPVRYPFGYGLSYTNFDIKPISASIDDGTFNMQVNVTNTGDVAGKEVVECYVELPFSAQGTEKNRLVSFVKTHLLDPNETRTYNLSFNINQLCSFAYNGLHSEIINKGLHIVKVGNCINNLKPVIGINSSNELMYQGCETLYRNSILQNELIAPERHTDPGNLKILDIYPSDLKYRNVNITHHDIDDNQVSNRVKLKTLVGKGFTSLQYPGAVGKIYDSVNQNWIVVNDGPAGCRVTKETISHLNGLVKVPASPIMPALSYYPKNLVNLVFGDASKAKNVIYNYATAFPSEISLAQTWNTDLIKEVGAAIGTEMREFNIDIILAPALNIIRNPLCGRSFEYFSEDPLLTSKCGISYINGIKSIAGRDVCIKHFCCNSQEANRQKYSANVSERALREIYLSAFRDTIIETKPAAVMSSYNKVNGFYVSETSTLLQNFLRQECGFDGFVMTDWYATGKKYADPVNAIVSGNDVIMPGTVADRMKVLSAYAVGVLDEQILSNVSNRVDYKK